MRQFDSYDFPLFQLVVEYDRGLLSMKLGSAEDVDEVVGHIGSCQQRICPGMSAVYVIPPAPLLLCYETSLCVGSWASGLKGYRQQAIMY